MAALLYSSYNGKDNIWSGLQGSELYNNQLSVGRIIYDTMKNWPSNVCQINDVDGVTVTFDQAITWAIRIAQHLKKRGLNHESIIGITAKNSTYLMPLGVACLMNTTPFHAVNPMLEEETIKHVYNITKPVLIFCDGNCYEKIRSATLEWQPEIYIINEPIEGIPYIESWLEPTTTELLYEPETLKSGGDQTASILCSSGTTGLPKAVCISHNRLIQNIEANSQTIIFVAAALDWLSGLWTFIICSVTGSTRIITNRAVTPDYLVQLIRQYKIDFVVLAPRQVSGLVECPDATVESLASLKKLCYAGGALSLATLQRAKGICKSATFNSLYAMTEVGCIAYNMNISNTASVGRVMPGLRIRIVDETGESLGYNQTGEIYAHTGRGWNGYYGNPEETKKMQDSEGWLHTGDLGYFDEQNFLYIVDRKKETLKYQGLHYWPTEIENAIKELEEVKEVCVVGIYSEAVGDSAGAVVVKSPGCDISSQDIIDHVARSLTGIQKQLHAGVRFVDKLPTNVNGKTLRKAAQDLFIGQST